jgi:hypothetical protein
VLMWLKTTSVYVASAAGFDILFQVPILEVILILMHQMCTVMLYSLHRVDVLGHRLGVDKRPIFCVASE